MWRRIIWAIVIPSVGALLTAEVKAQAVINYTPNENIVCGTVITYNLDHLAGMVKSYKWEYEPPNCPGTWLPVGATNNTLATQTVAEIYPGTFTVRCTIVYQSQMGMQAPATEMPTVSVAIPAPNGSRIFQGDNVEKQVGQYNPTIFVIKCGDLDAAGLVGLAQERITNFSVVGDPKSKTPDGGWTPAQKDRRFQLVTGDSKIIDLKAWPVNHPLWNTYAVGQVFATGTQSLRLLIPDPCNGANNTICPLGSYPISFKKVSATTYVILHE